MYKLTALVAALMATSGCVVHSYDYDEPDTVVIVEEPGPPVVYNYAPEVLYADGGVYWDDYYYDDIWYFEAEVDDLDGVLDVTQVWADVYDEYAGGVYIESFELFPTEDPYLWYSDWLGGTTLLDPFYAGYTVDIVAYDTFEDYGYSTFWAYTYAY